MKQLTIPESVPPRASSRAVPPRHHAPAWSNGRSESCSRQGPLYTAHRCAYKEDMQCPRPRLPTPREERVETHRAFHADHLPQRRREADFDHHALLSNVIVAVT